MFRLGLHGSGHFGCAGSPWKMTALTIWVIGDACARYVLESSSDLPEWTRDLTNTMAAVLQPVRTDASAKQQLFYRARLLP